MQDCANSERDSRTSALTPTGGSFPGTRQRSFARSRHTFRRCIGRAISMRTAAQGAGTKRETSIERVSLCKFEAATMQVTTVESLCLLI